MGRAFVSPDTQTKKPPDLMSGGLPLGDRLRPLTKCPVAPGNAPHHDPDR